MNMLLRRHHARTDGPTIDPGEIERTEDEQTAYDQELAGHEPATPDTSAEQSAEEQHEHQEHAEEQREADPAPTDAEVFAALERPKGNASTQAWLDYVAADPQRPDGYESLDRAALVALYPAE